jgi:hypothetical protein
MKKLLLISLFSLFLFTPIVNAIDPVQTSVCGRSYMITMDYELYILKFPISSFGPDCSGTMTFYWSNQNKSYTFTTQDEVFVDIVNLGNFALRNNKLYYIDPNTIILKEF